ncbi:MAG: cytochrome C oxidase subunit IV family protein [Nitrospiraceae bacterium]|nr:MAG: cytochrome C oxidase subunit IV family protein [Nitrospiraceae bacterium]
MEQRNTGHTAPGFKTYIIAWIALVILTAVTIAVTKIDTGAISILVALLIASVKSGLILYIFMHLGYERRFFKLAFLLPVLVFALSIWFTFLDVWYR